jgi:hypothetical protein
MIDGVSLAHGGLQPMVLQHTIAIDFSETLLASAGISLARAGIHVARRRGAFCAAAVS